MRSTLRGLRSFVIRRTSSAKLDELAADGTVRKACRVLRLLNASLLFVAVSVSAQDSTNSASVTIRESLHRSYRLITPRPGGIGPIVYNDHGRTSFAASSVLKDF